MITLDLVIGRMQRTRTKTMMPRAEYSALLRATRNAEVQQRRDVLPEADSRAATPEQCAEILARWNRDVAELRARVEEKAA